MIVIDKETVREELIKKNLFDTQKELLRQRRSRIEIMSMLLFALLFTLIFGTLQDPFLYTFSNIGNFFSTNNRIVFVIWAIISGLSIHTGIIKMFRLEDFKGKLKYTFVALATFFLIMTALIPALRDRYPFLHTLHTVFAGFYALFILLAMIPYVTWLIRENPRLKVTVSVWMAIIYIGSILILIFFGKSGLFELWFFMSLILFLLYLSLVLFEEKIIKLSVVFLKDEPNLNLAIEKIFIDLETKKKKDKDKNNEDNKDFIKT